MFAKKRSCDRCHKRKEQCQGDTPCERCRRHGVACSYNRELKKNGRPRSTDKVAVRKKYSRNGCVPCRKQKKKCDEKVPECQNCLNKGRTCWYSRNVPSAASKACPTLPGKTQHITEDVSIKCSPIADYKSPSLMALMTPSTLFNPTEKMFLDSLLDSSLMASSSPSHSSPGSSETTYEEQKLNLLESCKLNSTRIPENECSLLCYFISEVSMLLFADKTTTRFLSTVIPLCLVDKRVRYPIIAIASSHRLNSWPLTDYDHLRECMKYRAKAQSCLANKNDDFYDDTENVLLSICLVSIHEIFEGNSMFWNSALEKGSEIIRMRGGLKKVSSVSPLSIQLFCYLDHISSLSTCATPFIDRLKYDPYENYDGNHVEDILNCKFGFRFGIAGELFKIMGNISSLASLRANRHKSAEYEEQFESLATLIEMKLQNWSPSVIELAANYQIDGNLDSGKVAMSSYLLALQWSSFLRLHQIREGYNRSDTRVLACLSIILKSLKSLGVDSEIETGLMFPLIMAGSVCIEKHDREYILSRIRSIKEKLRFNYIGEFEKLLRAVWDKDNDSDSVNWAKIRYYQFPGLVMF